MFNSPPPRVVLLDDEPVLLDHLAESILRICPKATITKFTDASAACKEVIASPPDLFATDWNHGPPTGPALFSLLSEHKVTFPIFVISGNVSGFAIQCTTAPDLKITFIPKPYKIMELQQQLKPYLGPFTPAQASRPGCNPACIRVEDTQEYLRPRIILVDDLIAIHEMLGTVITTSYRHASVLNFTNALEAWEEIKRVPPDLLISDWCHIPLPGDELLQLLAARKVKFPILLMSAFAKAENVQAAAGPDLDVTFLMKPFSVSLFNAYLRLNLGPCDADVDLKLKRKPPTPR